MRLALLAFVLTTLAGFTPGQSADAPTKVRLGVLKFGTVSWVLDTIQRKIEGQDITADITPGTDTKMIDLMEALKASLAKPTKEKAESKRKVS